jgi:hypothetical protein
MCRYSTGHRGLSHAVFHVLYRLFQVSLHHGTTERRHLRGTPGLQRSTPGRLRSTAGTLCKGLDIQKLSNADPWVKEAHTLIFLYAPQI